LAKEKKFVITNHEHILFLQCTGSEKVILINYSL